MISISKELAHVQWSSTEIPPLGDSTQRLLALDEDGRTDPRLLALFAQQDPVILARLLAMANSTALLPSGSKPVTSAEGAVRVLGVRSTYTTMLGGAMAGTLLVKVEPVEIRRFLTKNAFTHWSVARNLSRFLSLDAEDAFVLQLAALLEPLGIYAGLLQPGDIGTHVRDEIERVLKLGGAACSYACDFEDYTGVSALIATEWGTPARVVATMTVPTTPDGVLLLATVELIKAKLLGKSQIAVLGEVLAEHEYWAGVNGTVDVDLVRFG